MQEWILDECILEFFIDIIIFIFIYEDFFDLELFNWCQSVEDFVRRYLEVFESDSVFEDFYYWIDFIFGYKVLFFDNVVRFYLQVERVVMIFINENEFMWKVLFCCYLFIFIGKVKVLFNYIILCSCNSFDE